MRAIEARAPKAQFRAVGDLMHGTWSCYMGNGRRCGKRESCANRKGAFKAAGIEDLTPRRA